MVLFCAKCWAQNPQDASTCHRCGAALQPLVGEYWEKLLSALHHPDPETVRMAAWVLGERREAAAVPALLDLLERTREPGALEAAVEALGMIGAPQTVLVLARLVSTWPLRVRLKVADTLRRIGGTEAEGVLYRLGETDPSKTVREAAKEALSALTRNG